MSHVKSAQPVLSRENRNNVIFNYGRLRNYTRMVGYLVSIRFSETGLLLIVDMAHHHYHHYQQQQTETAEC